MNNPSPLIDLFVKYLQDRCSPDEVRRLMRYFEVEENEEVLKHLIRAELGFIHQGEITDSKEDAVLLGVKTALIHTIRHQDRRSGKSPVFIRKWLKIALWLAVCCPTAFLMAHFSGDIKSYFGPVKRFTLVTGTGERKSLTLSDGTKIWLSPSSALEYPDQLTGDLREVKLEGEAFFEVARDKKHPFIVHSGRMDTRVVGTSFTVQSYKTQLIATVTVVTGIVKVSAAGASAEETSSVVLKPNQRSRFDRYKGTLIRVNYPDAGQMRKRKDGILKYDGAPVGEVIADLARYYSLPMLIKSRSKNCLCYGEFDTNRPVAIVLEQLAAAINATVITQKDQFILKGGCEE